MNYHWLIVTIKLPPPNPSAHWAREQGRSASPLLDVGEGPGVGFVVT